MNCLYLDLKNLGVRLDGQALILYENDVQKGSVPLHILERIVIRGNVQLESRVLGELSARNIGLLVLSGRNSDVTTILAGKTHNESSRRLGQYRISLDDELRAVLAHWLVIVKVRAQRRLLCEALLTRADLRYSLTEAVQRLDNILNQLRENSDKSSLLILRGFEGAAASAYFSGFIGLFTPSLNFTGRNKRPPPDPVNACLSLGYTLLYHDAAHACHIAGLDTMLGFYHDISFGRESLACDLMEPLRPLIDRWVWWLFRDRILRKEHFCDDKGRCLLNKTGRKHFYGFYESNCGAMRRLLRRYSYALARRYQTVYSGK